MRFISDLHGKMNLYQDFTRGCKESIQLGDLGHGFTHIPDFGPTHLHIHGNHDNPALAIKHPRFLGRFGIDKTGMFYVSGAYSIDRSARIQGVSLFSEEELTYQEAELCLELYKRSSVRMVVSHDCPLSVSRIINNNPVKGITNNLLQSMFEFKNPPMWIFGHHHVNFSMEINSTRFICVPKESYLDI